MSDPIALSSGNIDELANIYAEDDHFLSIVLPRLKYIDAVRQSFGKEGLLEWKIKYSPVNRSASCVRISLFDKQKKFHFYYEIPLSIGLHIHLYLGDNTFNFFEAYPLLIEHGTMLKDEFLVEATVNTLPHLVLTGKKEKYEQAILRKDDYSQQLISESKLYNLLEQFFSRFNKVLYQIIDGTIQL